MTNFKRSTRTRVEVLTRMVDYDNFERAYNELQTIPGPVETVIAIPESVTLDQLQQLKSQLLNFEKRLNEHLDKHKKNGSAF